MNEEKLHGQVKRTPESIEQESRAIIRTAVGGHRFSQEEYVLVERMIQASGDLEFAQTVAFHQMPIKAGIDALQRGCPLIVDVEMVASGLRMDRLQRLDVEVLCRIRDAEVRKQALAQGTTRASVAVELLTLAHPDAILAIGNAPTALWRVIELIEAGRIHPSLIVGLPVGFVLAAEAKDALAGLRRPSIVCRGRKGGSAVTVAALNGLVDLALDENGSR